MAVEIGDRAKPVELLGETDEWMHDLDEGRLAGPFLDRDGGANDRPHLHLVDLGPEQAEPAPARAQHRVRLLERLDPLAHTFVRRLLEGRQELVQRRVEEADRHREAGHGLEDPLEVGLLHRQQLVQSVPPLVLAGGHDHLADDRQPFFRR